MRANGPMQLRDRPQLKWRKCRQGGNSFEVVKRNKNSSKAILIYDNMLICLYSALRSEEKRVAGCSPKAPKFYFPYSCIINRLLWQIYSGAAHQQAPLSHSLATLSQALRRAWQVSSEDVRAAFNDVCGAAWRWNGNECQPS